MAKDNGWLIAQLGQLMTFLVNAGTGKQLHYRCVRVLLRGKELSGLIAK